MKRFFKVFFGDEGELKFGWRLAFGVACYMLAFYGVIWGLGAGFGALFAAWGLTNANLAYAPVWARQIVFWHTDFTYMLAYALSLLAAVTFAKVPAKALDGKIIRTGALAGAGLGAVLTLVAFALDSMRLEWPLGEPSFSPYHISALAVLLLGSFSGEALSKRLVFGPVRMRFGRFAGFAAVAALSVALSGAWTKPTALVSAALMGITGCALYERGGLFASAAMAAGWTAWTTWLFAWPNGNAVSVYRMYMVSDPWLTGGNAGANAGLGAVIGWMIIAAFLLRGELRGGIARIKKERITNGKDSDCNRRSGLQRRELLRSGSAGDAGPRRGRRAG